MAGIAVFVELRGTDPTRATRWAIAEARRVANAMGATVYALVGSATVAVDGDEGLAASLGRAGADRIVLCRDPVFGAPPSPATHGRLAELFVNRLRPRLLLFPPGGVGLELATWVAARTSSAIALRATLVSDEGEPSRFEVRQRDVDAGGARGGIRRLSLGAGATRTIVAALASGDPPPANASAGAAELDELSYPTTVGTIARDLDTEEPLAGGDGDVEDASMLVLVADAAPPEAVRRLSEALPDGAAIVVRGDGWPPELAAAAPTRVLIVAADELAGEPPPLALPPAALVAYASAHKPPAGWPAADVQWKTVGADALAAVATAFGDGRGARKATGAS